MNIIPCAMQMSVKKKNHSHDPLTYIKAETSQIGLREGTMSPVGNQKVPEEIP